MKCTEICTALNMRSNSLELQLQMQLATAVALGCTITQRDSASLYIYIGYIYAFIRTYPLIDDPTRNHGTTRWWHDRSWSSKGNDLVVSPWETLRLTICCATSLAHHEWSLDDFIDTYSHQYVPTADSLSPAHFLHEKTCSPFCSRFVCVRENSANNYSPVDRAAALVISGQTTSWQTGTLIGYH